MPLGKNPGGRNLFERKRFKVYTDGDNKYCENYDKAVSYKKVTSCCNYGAYTITYRGTVKTIVCKKCDRTCKLKKVKKNEKRNS